MPRPSRGVSVNSSGFVWRFWRCVRRAHVFPECVLEIRPFTVVFTPEVVRLVADGHVARAGRPGRTLLSRNAWNPGFTRDSRRTWKTNAIAAARSLHPCCCQKRM